MSPLERLNDDRKHASSAGDPWANLAVFATVAGDGTPHARVLILRDVDTRIGVFFNSTSPKQRELATSPRVALVTYYTTRSTQYRLGATLSPIAPTIVRKNWRLRPAIPKAMDWLYTTRVAQSSVMASRDALLALHSAVAAEVGSDPDAPETAVGYYVDVDTIDRLELANDRVHDRRRYVRAETGWMEEVLVP